MLNLIKQNCNVQSESSRKFVLFKVFEERIVNKSKTKYKETYE